MKTLKKPQPIKNKYNEVFICGPTWARTKDPLIMSIELNFLSIF